jgi:hypothetical protein
MHWDPVDGPHLLDLFPKLLLHLWSVSELPKQIRQSDAGGVCSSKDQVTDLDGNLVVSQGIRVILLIAYHLGEKILALGHAPVAFDVALEGIDTVLGQVSYRSSPMMPNRNPGGPT